MGLLIYLHDQKDPGFKELLQSQAECSDVLSAEIKVCASKIYYAWFDFD